LSTKTKLIFNAHADRGHAWDLAHILQAAIDRRGGGEWAATQYPGHASQLAAEAADEGFMAVVALGGDGTIHEVVNGLMRVPLERRPTLGAVPVGSGNDFCANVGISTDPETAIHAALNGTERLIDIGTITDNTGRTEYWDNTINLGFGASVAIYSYQITRLRGYPMYVWAVIQTILKKHDAPNMTIKTDNEAFTQPVLLLSLNNGRREGGGFLTAPDALPDDGLLNYTTINDVSRLMMFRLLPEVMRGTHGRFPQVRMGQFKELTATSETAIPIHTDGEIYADFSSQVHEITVKIIPEALKVRL
jgi:diacylglycerol kinase (ATP)